MKYGSRYVFPYVTGCRSLGGMTPTRPTCPPTCTSHRQHVYVLCFGKPTRITSRDRLLRDPTRDYPVSHYVGYTAQQPPSRRIVQHGAMCADQVALVMPGTERDEFFAKAYC